MLNDMLFWFLVTVDIVSIMAIFYAAGSSKLTHFSAGIKLGLILVGLGVSAQLYKSLTMFLHDSWLMDWEFMLCYLKDIGIAVIALSWIWYKCFREKK